MSLTKKLFINFADFILRDYEIVTDDQDNLMWELAGTMQRYTSEELYERYVDYLNEKQD
jgi:hypothetical protein